MNNMTLPVLFGPVGPEMLIILGVLVLLFGAQRIPKLANSVGRSLGSFKKGRQEVEDELKEIETEVKEPVTEVKSEVNEASKELERETETAVNTVEETIEK